jgi:hypothetical protein
MSSNPNKPSSYHSFLHIIFLFSLLLQLPLLQQDIHNGRDATSLILRLPSVPDVRLAAPTAPIVPQDDE